MIFEGVWQLPVAAFLCAGAIAGSLLGSLLRWRSVRALARGVVAVLLSAAILAAGVAATLALLDARHGPISASPETAETELMAAEDSLDQGVISVEGATSARTAFEDPVGALHLVFETGAEQLAGAGSDEADETWDLLIVLAGSGLAALLAALCSSRALRGAAALVPLALSAVDQSIMGASARLEWVGAAIALGLLIVWLSTSRRPRAVRGVLVAALACALGWGSAALAPSGSFSPWSAGGPRVETLVDLSRDLRNRSDEPVLTYETTSLRPVYLRLGVLDTFDGSTWRFGGREGTALEEDSALYWAGRDEDFAAGTYAANLAPLVTTTLVPYESGDQTLPAPPGTTVELLNDDGSLVASGRYLSPITAESYLNALLNLAPSLGGYDARSDGPDERTTEVPARLPDEVASVVSRARGEGAGASADNIVSEVEAVGWLVSYFTDESFSYSLDAPGGDGQDNLEAINDFLLERRGYCTHYATAFALLARGLGVPSRVALGYAPSSERDASGNYVVTMSDLHAWAEVWFDGIGWVGVDVTPAAQDDEGDEPLGSDDPTQEPEPEPDAEPGPDAEPEPEPETPADDPEGGEVADEPAAAQSAAFPWQAVVLLALTAAAVVGGAVVLLVRRRRAASSQVAWRRICRRAWRSGVRWDKSATEDVIVERICERLDDDAQAAEVRRVARNACLERYGA